MIPDSRKDHAKKEQIARLRYKICTAVLALHILVVGIPVFWGILDNFFRPPKLNAFRVKIGPKELSHAPEVGPPERKRPGGSPPAPQAPAPKTPEKPIPQEPKVEVPAPKPKPKPKPKAKPKPKPKAKPKAKPVPKAKPTAKAKPVPKAKPEAKPKAKPRDLQSEVYRPAPGTNEFKVPGQGGRNFNRNVPIGSRDRGQEKGPADYRTPGGGLSEKMEQYNRNAARYLKHRWAQPPKSLLGDTLPSVVIELDIAADGRVFGKRIITLSGNTAMDDSVRRMLQQLDRMPTPPEGKVCIQFALQTEDE